MGVEMMLIKEIERSGDSARIIDVPKEKRITAASLQRLENEIGAQVRANEAMRNRSMQNAMKTARC